MQLDPGREVDPRAQRRSRRRQAGKLPLRSGAFENDRLRTGRRHPGRPDLDPPELRGRDEGVSQPGNSFMLRHRGRSPQEPEAFWATKCNFHNFYLK